MASSERPKSPLPWRELVQFLRSGSSQEEERFRSRKSPTLVSDAFRGQIVKVMHQRHECLHGPKGHRGFDPTLAGPVERLAVGMPRLLLVSVSIVLMPALVGASDSPDLEVVRWIKQEAYEDSQVMEHLFQLVDV